MADNFTPLQAQTFSLAGAGIVIGATSITLKSFLTIDGDEITMSMLGDIAFMTLEPGNGALEEQICFTGVSQNANGTATLTGVSNVLFEKPYTQTSGVLKTHAGSTIAVLSNTSGFYNELTGKDNDEIVTGYWEFPSGIKNPTIGSPTYVAPTLPTQIATKAYVDSVAVAGAPDASTTAKGIVEIPTQAEMDAKTSTGGTGAILAVTPTVVRSTLLSDYVVDTGAANAYVITPAPAITAYTTGQIFTFKAANTNTLTSTINVSGLGTKTIKRGGAVLGAGDIISGQMYMIEYDGTDFQLISTINTTPSGVMQMYVGAAAPTGWLLCDGTSYLRTTYPALFAVIGTTFGAADGTHFNVPDMRGRTPVGVGTGTGGGASGTGAPTGGSALTAVALSTWKGEETHTLSVSEMPAHTHAGTYGGTGGGSLDGRLAAGTDISSNAAAATTQGGGGAHNNIQPVMGVNFIIKT